jgi:hypothetical protein
MRGQPEKDSQNRKVSTGQPERNSQNGTASTVQAKQDRQNRTVSIGLSGQRDRAAETGQP